MGHANGNGRRPTSAGKRGAVRPSPRPPLVPQPNGGALYVGGVPGNAGGGRPTNEMRQRLARIVEERYEVIENVADGVATYALRAACEHCGKAPTGKGPTKVEALEKAPTTADRLRALDMAMRYSIGERVDAVSDEWVREQLVALRRIVRETLPDELATALLARVAQETFQ